MWDLIVSVPDHCLSFYFYLYHKVKTYLSSLLLEEQSKKISNDQELIQSDPISRPQNQKGNN